MTKPASLANQWNDAGILSQREKVTEAKAFVFTKMLTQLSNDKAC